MPECVLRHDDGQPTVGGVFVELLFPIGTRSPHIQRWPFRNIYVCNILITGGNGVIADQKTESDDALLSNGQNDVRKT